MIKLTKIFTSITNIHEIVAKMNLVLFQTKKQILNQEWIYRGEGNANIVISLPEPRQILRIRKTNKPKTFLEWFFDWIINFLNWDCKNEINNEWKDLSFYKKVMMPLLGNFVCDATPFYMSRKQINDLNKAIVQSRPEFRKHKKLQYGRATFFTDYAFLPKFMDAYKLQGATFSVEIKPKQGWISLQSRVYSKCQFCRNQYLKLQKSQIQKISTYCPLDLFSGDKERMIKAIKSLIYNPQNNFKVFRNGILTYGDNVSVDVFYKLIEEWLQSNTKKARSSLIEEFCDLVYCILTKQCKEYYKDHQCTPHIKTYSNGGKSSCTSEEGCNFTESALPEGCVLERILSIQKFDQLGLNRYAEMYDSLKSNGHVNSWTYIDRLIKEIYYNRDESLRCPRCVIMKYINRTKNCDNSENARMNVCELELMPYLIASVVNDCSLMLTCRQVDNENIIPDEHIVRTGYGNFAVNIGVFDLYPKPMSTIGKHVRRKAKIHEACSHV